MKILPELSMDSLVVADRKELEKHICVILMRNGVVSTAETVFVRVFIRGDLIYAHSAVSDDQGRILFDIELNVGEMVMIQVYSYRNDSYHEVQNQIMEEWTVIPIRLKASPTLRISLGKELIHKIKATERSTTNSY